VEAGLQARSLKLDMRLPICERMSVTSLSTSLSSPGTASPEAQEIERQAAVMRKARDVQQSQAEGLIALVNSARPDGVGQNLSVYA
jgi:hypothetical protein